ncbi:hypothetical protein OIV83_000698 [Microbotryomycetes sp. JL201]|nr:hypothetical protein OIV83_000698 [Microbotryomycetes sp. JL201]
MDRFQRLQALLESVLASPTGEAGVLNKLQLKLERARPHFLDLLDHAPKNATERQQLEKGSFTYVATGTTYPASQSLVKDILALSDALDLSENVSASLVSFGINSKPRGTTQQQPHATTQALARAESGLVVFLDERAAMLGCLHAIWRGALSADDRLQNNGVQRILEREAEELVRGRGADVAINSTSNKRGSWVSKVIAALDSCKAQAESLAAQLRQPIASNNSLVPASSTSAGQGPKFSDETIQMRIHRLEQERCLLGQLLFLIGAAGQLGQVETLSLVRQLSQAQASDSAVVYVLVALLAALDVSEIESTQQPSPLMIDSKFVSDMTTTLATQWAVGPLKAVVQLQWSSFLEAASRVADVASDGGEAVEQLCWSAIEGGAFAFLGRSVLSFKWDSELHAIWGDVGREVSVLADGSTIDPWFQTYVTDQVERLVLDVISTKFSTLRKLRNREEDSVSTTRRGGLRSSREHPEDKPSVPRHVLESFFLLVATVYYGLSDAGVKFWADVADTETSAPSALSARLAAFLRWGSESRSPAMMRSFYEMVSSLASGPESATYAFELLSAGNALGGGKTVYQSASSSLSWSALFGALEFYRNNMSDGPDGPVGEMPPEEVPLLQSFIRLLRQVVSYSDVARATLYDNQRHRPIATLFALLGRPIPIELKASLIGAIAAFSRPGGAFGIDVARRTWTALEQSQILPTIPAQARLDMNGSTSMRTVAPASMFDGGIVTELEQVEAPNKVFPESTAFVALLNVLIHASPAVKPVQRGVEFDQQTIPDNLGAPQRTPGVEPYVRFVIDDVLLKTGQREYANPTERWIVTNVCLEFVERCLVSFELGPVIAWASLNGQRTSAASSPLVQILAHPGFDILTRLLSASALLETVLTLVIAGYDAIRNNLAGTPLFTECMLRCLRVLHRVFELQAPFLEVVMPLLAESNLTIPQDKLKRLRSAVPIDQSLLYQPEAVVQISLLIGCDEQDEIALLAVQLLTSIADSPFFDVVQKFPEQSRVKLNRLVGLLQSSPETLRILDGVIARLEDDLPESELDMDIESGLVKEGSRHAIKTALLDLLLACTRVGRTAPNVAHLLLGFNVTARLDEMTIDDPEAANTERTALHVVLDLLAQNVSTEDDQQLSILVRQPTLAAKCYQLVRQLCLHPYTSGALSRYLRTREQFFTSQTLALPFAVPTASAGSLGAVQYPDSRQAVTSCSALCAIMQSEAWLLESTALELSVLSTAQDTRRLVELISALFETRTPTVEDDDMAAIDQDGLSQALPRILEVFHSFDFAWQDAIHVTDARLNFFAELNFDSCLRKDESGCEVYDFGLLLSLVAAARRELQARGVLTSQAQQEEAKNEVKTIIETLVVDNHRREIQFARFQALRSWRNLLDIALTKSFHLLPAEGRHSLLLDLLYAVLPPLSAQDTDPAIAELLSGGAVLLMTKLRDEGVRLAFAETSDTVQAVAPGRLHAVLRAVLQAILQPGVSPVVRGNLYAVMLNYIHYSTKMSQSSTATLRALLGGDNDNVSVEDDVISLDGTSTIGGTRRSKRNALDSGNFSILQSTLDRLLPVICRDAAVGHEVWRTVAFTVLDALVMVAEEGRATSKLVAVLTRQGFLQSFVSSLKDAEASLSAVLSPDPESLNALYIYEAQMSFLTRIASNREGAEKLLNADLLTKLGDCEFLTAQSLEDAASMEFDGFLPSTTERYHQILLPALQLGVSALTSFGADTAIATRQAQAFVVGQRENLLIALRNCTTSQSLSSMQEARLIVTLMTIILPSVSDDEMTALSAFGGLHSALLTLSGKLCGSQDWIDKVVPTNDVEREDDQVLVLALRNNGTIFSDKVHAVAEAVEAALFTYFSVATRRRPGTNAFKPVLLPIGRTSDKPSAGPSLASTGAFLCDVATGLVERIADAERTTECIDAFGTIALEEIEEAFAFPDAEGIDMNERRARVLQELHSLQAKYRSQVASSLHLLELGLLLYWRHISFFLDPERAAQDVQARRPDFGVGLAESLRNRTTVSTVSTVSSFDLPNLRQALADEFSESIAGKLRAVELTAKSVGANYRNRQSFLEVCVRRLQEALVQQE